MVRIIAAHIYSGLAKALGECLTKVTLFNPHLTSFITILCRTWCVYPHVTNEEAKVERQDNSFSTTQQLWKSQNGNLALSDSRAHTLKNLMLPLQ